MSFQNEKKKAHQQKGHKLVRGAHVGNIIHNIIIMAFLI